VYRLRLSKLAALTGRHCSRTTIRVNISFEEFPAKLPQRDDLGALASRVSKNVELRQRIIKAVSLCEFVSFGELADACGVSEEEARSHAAAVALTDERVRWSARGLFWYGTFFKDELTTTLGVSPWTLEKLAIQGRASELDMLLGPTQQLTVTLRGQGRGAPRLRWKTGATLSERAQQFLLACLTRPELSEATLLLSPLLDEDSLFELGVWLLSDPKAHKKERWVLPPSNRLEEELARAHAHGFVKQPWRFEGLCLSVLFLRWALRWWSEAKGAERYDLRFAFRRGAARVPLIELWKWLPTRDEIVREGIAGEAWWRRRIIEATELAMVGQHPLPMHRARRTLLANDVARDALQGVVFHIEGHGLAWLGPSGLTASEGPLDVPGWATVRVAHPAVDTAAWPAESQSGPEPFPQRKAPGFRIEDLPAPTGLAEVPLKTWRARCHALGYLESSDSYGSVLGAFREIGQGYSLEIVHTGHGKGYGGPRPVSFVRARTKHPSPAATAALVADVRVLFGLDPLPAPADEHPPPKPPPPDVLDEKFWSSHRG